MADNVKMVPLKDTSANDKVKEFTAEHAERLLAYPGSKWAAVVAEQKPAAATTDKPTAPKAGAGK